MNKNEIKKIVENLITTFLSAGEICLQLREKGLTKKIKSDNTPVSNGDIKVNEILTKKLSELTPNIAIVSEENSAHKDDKNLKNFWLIDPIDGTKVYIAGGNEYTLNAGLIINNHPAIGVIGVPKKNEIFYSFGKNNSYLFQSDKVQSLNCKKKTPKGEILALTNHKNPPKIILEKLKEYGVTSFRKLSSSYKYCLIAKGDYDLYIDKVRANEWDDAAGHAIAESAGAIVTSLDLEMFKYGKEDYKNPSLLIKRAENLYD